MTEEEQVEAYVKLSQHVASMKYTVLAKVGPRGMRRRWAALYPNGDIAASLTFYKAGALIGNPHSDPPTAMFALDAAGDRVFTEPAYYVQVWPERVGTEPRSMTASSWFPVEKDEEEWAAAELWLVDQLARIGWLLILPNRVYPDTESP